MHNQSDKTRKEFAIEPRFICAVLGYICFAAFTLPAAYAETLQQAYLKASNTEAGDDFGHVAISGDTLVIGASNEDSNATGINGDQGDNSADGAGAVYVYTRDNGTWSQQAYLKASNTEAGDSFGSSVAISGDTIVVGAPRERSNATGINGDQSDNSADWAGAVYVFTRSGTTWSQQAYLKASNTDAEDYFSSVAISGDTLVVGASGEDSSARGINGDQGNESADGAGAVYVFNRDGTTWSQQAYLKASNAEAGDGFGNVAISGDTLVVSAPGEESNATGINGDQADNSAPNSGAAYVFTRSGTTWSQQAYLKASETSSSDAFGGTVAISGDSVVVGSHFKTTQSGAAFVFNRSGTVWSQQANLTASNPDAYDQFGSSVAISGDTVLVGARFEDSSATGTNGDQSDNSEELSGAAYVFARDGTTWSQQAYLKASNAGFDDEFGGSVAISGETLVIGARQESSNATGVNGDQGDNSAERSGAAYVFETFSINPGLNGFWWNGLERNGEGVQVEVSDAGDGRQLFVITFYSYDPMGNQIFLIAVGLVNGDIAEVDVFITEGGLWGYDFDPELVNETQWGTGIFSASDCEVIHMELMPNAEFMGMGYTDLMYDLVRATAPLVPCPVYHPNLPRLD
jgi:hypothetical protein